ncbi:Tn7-like element transposition protein TnsE [Clostridium ihumii]|uniref:Tn7-like element transposition protein TnsE n=1 Tax=Clostridium ihumii TaxID=1470356 RepID=UPI003D332E67
MGKIKLKIKNWPFKLGEKVQLIWIGEPFKYNNKWMIDTYFNDGKITKKVIQDWANIHFLSIDKYYTDGDLNSGKVIDELGNMSIIDIDLSDIIPKYNENNWNIKMSYYKSKSRTFNFYKNKVLYSIPLVEIIRSVLAPNSFMLNTILYNDTFEDYFTYEVDDNALNLYFNNNYRNAYLKDNYYNHLAWIISNEEILKIIDNIGYNISINNKMMFDFYIRSFKFKARVKRNKVGYTILEILKIKEKNIKFDQLNIYHPSFEEQKNSDKSKLRKYINLNKDSDRTIDNEIDGSNKVDESIHEELITHEYINIPKIKKEKVGYKNKRTNEDEKTKRYFIEDDKKRTLSDEGGENITKGIEISNIDIHKVDGELKEFIEVLNILKTMEGIESVEINIRELPLGRKFSYLSDGVTRRKCLIGKIISKLDKKFVLLEVERQTKPLSTLIIESEINHELDNVCETILKGLVKTSGNWNSELLDYLSNKNIVFKRIKHIKKDNFKVAEYIINKINCKL